MAGGNYASQAASTVFAIGSSTAGTATSTLVTVLSSGAVDIGQTTNSLGELNVNGGIYATNFYPALTGTGYSYGTNAQYLALTGPAGAIFNQGSDLASGNSYTFEETAGANLKSLTSSNSQQSFLYLIPNIKQTSTASYTGISLLTNDTSLGSGSNYLMNLQIGGAADSYATTTVFDITDNGTGGGNVGIGTTSPYANLSVMAGGNYASQAASTVFAIGSSTAGTATSTLMTVNSAGNLTVLGTLAQGTEKSCSLGLTTDASGNINGCVASDETLKTDITSPTYNALDIIEELTPVFYRWKDTENRDALLHAGFIAQSVQKVYPGAVTSAGTGLLGVDSNAILAVVVDAIKSIINHQSVQDKEIAQLQAEVAQLQAQPKQVNACLTY